MIRNIVFDMGGVLMSWNPQKLLDERELNEEEKKLIMRELFHETEWLALDEGTVSEQQAFEAVSARLPENLHSHVHELIFGWWKEPFENKEGMEELIRSLHQSGYRIYLLSNASIRQAEYFHRLPGSQCFEGRMTSAEEKIIKPQKDIFELFLKRFDLKAEECLFIDDSNANVFAASKCGMEGIVYHDDTPLLIERLKEKGIHFV